MSRFEFNAQNYQEYEAMVAKTTRRKSQVRKDLEAANKKLAALRAENAQLVTSFKHWHMVGKTANDPCRKCRYPMTHVIHFDQAIGGGYATASI